MWSEDYLYKLVLSFHSVGACWKLFMLSSWCVTAFNLWTTSPAPYGLPNNSSNTGVYRIFCGSFIFCVTCQQFVQLLTPLKNHSSSFVHALKPAIPFLFPIAVLIWHSTQVKHRCCLSFMRQFWFHLQENSVHFEFTVFQSMEHVSAPEAPSGVCFCWYHFTIWGTCGLFCNSEIDGGFQFLLVVFIA